MTDAEVKVLEHRKEFLTTQLADAKLSQAIYKRIMEKFGKEGDEQNYLAECEKVDRLQTALEVVVEMMGDVLK